MPIPAPPPELMPSLGRLVRGLAALFWGLPVALVVCVQTAKTNLLAPLGVWPPILANALLFYALEQVGHFQKQERVWRFALDRVKVICVVNLGLSPFLYWWKLLPHEPHYQLAVTLLALSGLVFLFNLNHALQRLAAMLPDETLRLETRMFTTLNLYLLLIILSVSALWTFVGPRTRWPAALAPFLPLLDRASLIILLLLVLLPVALTMALLWKIKEVVLAGVFGPERLPKP